MVSGLTDPLESHGSEPRKRHINIVPSDVADIATDQRGRPLPVCVYVGEAGDVTGLDMAGTEATWYNCPVGFVIPAFFKRVLDTGTTADKLTGAY